MHRSSTRSYHRDLAQLQGFRARLLATAALLSSVAAASSWAGPNAGGTLILHVNPSYNQSCDLEGPHCGNDGLTNCADANARWDSSDRLCAQAFVLAAFPDHSFPRLVGASFGIDYDPNILVVTPESCADFELAGESWPEPGSGTALAFASPRTSRLTELYVFNLGYQYTTPTAFSLVPHPTQGGYFGDDHVPARLDVIADFGVLGFNQPGSAPCPAPLAAIGACCLPDGTCEMREPADCEGELFTYQGDDVECAPGMCVASPGACCFPTGGCEVLSSDACAAENGVFQGYGTACSPDLCPPGGACCLSDGLCAVLTSDSCADIDGLWLGAGTVCDPNPCLEVPGACCLPTGVCEVLAVGECVASEGIFQGLGSDCSLVVCPPAGACCYADGTCTLRFLDACTGEYQGTGSSCDPNPCPQPCNLRPVVHWENRPEPKSGFEWPSDSGASGGPNRSGVLILHGDPAISYTDGGDFCGQFTLTRCVDAVMRHDGAEPIVIFACAAFAEAASPRLAGLSFGITYGNCVVLDAWGACADFEFPTAQWPEPGEGTALSWSTAQTSTLTPVYWFAAYSYEGRVDELRLIAHPTQGATFADDSVPAVLDPVRALGSFGFGRTGTITCPSALPGDGACCLLTGECVVVSATSCVLQEGTYGGDWSDCPLEPCEPRGACCRVTGCTIRTAEQCAADGGVFEGVGEGCDPNPCGSGGGCRPGAISGTRGDESAAVGHATGTLLPDPRGTGCGTLNLNADGTYENGFSWSYGGVRPPYYGAFAECYSATGNICSLVLDLTQIGVFNGESLDAYIWDDGGGCPGNVLGVRVGYVPTGIAFWPSVSRHVADISVAISGNFWAGYWPNWPGGTVGFYIGADLDGFGGCPFTNIAPGIGYASGWQRVDVVWGPTQALGIGVELGDGPTATRKMSWGRVKALYGK